MDIGVVDSQNRTVKSTVTKKSDDVWYVEYTATVTGLHSVNVFFAGVAIPKSPYAVGVSPGLYFSRFVVISKNKDMMY